MAAGSVVVYMQALEDILLGLHGMESATLCAQLVSAGYTPSAKSHSDWDTQISANLVTEAGYDGPFVWSTSGVQMLITRPDPSHVRFDLTDCTFNASALMDAKYVVVYRQSNDRPVCYFDLETGATSGVEATKIVVQWPATGVFQLQQAGVS